MTETPAPWIVVTGLDGAGKTTLVGALAARYGAKRFRLPFHDFVRPALARSGNGRPYADVLTDRLVFAADARLTNYLVRQWRSAERLLVSQRGWMDNYVFGAVQGVDWSETAAMLQTADLERPSVIIHLIADPETAFERIRHDQKADKFETPAFIRRQHRETVRFYEASAIAHPSLRPFAGIPSVLIDTTAWAPVDVLDAADAFVTSALGIPAVSPAFASAAAGTALVP
jgi:thymidylate kinase